MYSQEGGRGKRGWKGKKMTCPFEGHIEDFMIGLTEGLKVMLHEMICNDKF